MEVFRRTVCFLPRSRSEVTSSRYVDLLLYIARNTWTMYKTYGVLVATGEVQGGRALARENAMSGD